MGILVGDGQLYRTLVGEGTALADPSHNFDADDVVCLFACLFVAGW